VLDALVLLTAALLMDEERELEAALEVGEATELEAAFEVDAALELEGTIELDAALELEGATDGEEPPVQAKLMLLSVHVAVVEEKPDQTMPVTALPLAPENAEKGRVTV
jgi:hypothetical protein